MNITNISSGSELAAAHELRAAMQGKVVLVGDNDYVQTRQIWNGAVEHQPALFAVCETPADVQAAVRSAREHAATAFGLRKEHFMVEIIAAWEPTSDDDGDTYRDWARIVSENLAPHALPGGYLRPTATDTAALRSRRRFHIGG